MGWMGFEWVGWVFVFLYDWVLVGWVWGLCLEGGQEVGGVGGVEGYRRLVLVRCLLDACIYICMRNGMAGKFSKHTFHQRR